MLSLPILSQSNSGLETGINISNANISPNPSVSTDSRTGLILGGTVDIGVSPRLTVVTGLRYVMKKWKFVSGGTTTTTRPDYIEFPVLLKVKFPLTEINPYIVVGPTLGLNVSATSETSNNQSSVETDIKSNVESADVGILFGAGLDFTVSANTNLFFQTAFSLGISNINKAANSTSTVKNYGLQLTGGVKFGL